MKKSMSKVFMPIILVATFLLSAVSGIIYFSNKNKGGELIAAETAIESPLAVRKITGDYADEYFFEKKDNNGETITGSLIQSSLPEDNKHKQIKNNELILLDTTNNQKVLVSFNVNGFNKVTASPTEGGTSTPEYNPVLADENITYYTLQVNAYLNNRPIVTNETIKDQEANASKYYYHFLDLNNIEFTDGTTPATAEGKYKFVF